MPSVARFGTSVLLASLFTMATTHCGSQRTTHEEKPAETKQEIWHPRWVNLGGDAQGDPAISSWASGRLDVFWRGTDNTLKHRWHDGGWSWLEPLGGDVRTSPAAVAKPTHIDVFYFNANRDLVRHFWPNASGLWGVEPIPLAAGDKPPIGSGPAVASWEPGRLDVFWRGVNGNLLHITRPDYNSGWLGVEDLGEYMTSDPAAVSWGGSPNIDVFFRNEFGALIHKYFPGCEGCGFWQSQALTANGELMGGTLGGGPGVASWGPGRLDVFWRRATYGTLGHTWRWDGDGPHAQNWVGGVENLGGNPASGVDAVSWGPSRIDVVGKQPLSPGNNSGNDVALLTWQTQTDRFPWWSDPPALPTIVVAEHVVTQAASPPNNPWEFSTAVAPPGTNGCPNGGYVVSGRKYQGPTLLRRTPLNAVPTQTQDNVAQLGGNSNNVIEDDSMMTRAPNGDLILLRGVIVDNTCGIDGEQTICTTQACGNERRSATKLWRSANCGQTWTTNEDNNIDPLKWNYGSGEYGGGACWGGWDREEVYYDYFSDQLFITFGGETDTFDNRSAMFMLRSLPGGVGPFYFHRYKQDAVHQPVMMTSLPGMMFFAACEDGQIALRWIEPDNSHWEDLLWNQPFPEDLTGMRRAVLPGACGYHGDWGHDGSMSVSRVGRYWDDEGTQWWVVRVAALDPSLPGARITSVRVNAAGTMDIPLLQQTVQALSPPSGQTVGRIAQLTMIEPDPSQTKPANLPWDGENTTLYYWREEYWTPGSGGAKINPQWIVRARAVRDISGYGPVFNVSSWKTGAVGPSGGKPGDFARGGFFFDPASSAANAPLKYLVVWSDLVTGTAFPAVRAKTYALPRGMGNN